MGWFSKLAGNVWNATPTGMAVNAINRERRSAAGRHSEKQAFWKANGGDPNQRYNQAIVDEGNGGGWEDALTRTAGSLYSRQLPQLRNDLQLTREDGIRRGISTGDLGTSNEGDLVSSWGQNFADTLGGMAMTGHENSRNRYLDLLVGRMDRDSQSRDWWKPALGGALGAGARVLGAKMG